VSSDYLDVEVCGPITCGCEFCREGMMLYHDEEVFFQLCGSNGVTRYIFRWNLWLLLKNNFLIKREC